MWARTSSMCNINRISFQYLLLSKCSLMIAYNKDQPLLQNLLCPIYDEFHTSRTRDSQVKICSISVTLKKVLKTSVKRKKIQQGKFLQHIFWQDLFIKLLLEALKQFFFSCETFLFLNFFKTTKAKAAFGLNSYVN